MGQFVKGQSGNPKGRPRKAHKFAGEVARTEGMIAAALPERVEKLLRLANGGYERVEETWAPAGTLWVGTGEYARRMFPDLEPDAMVLVKRTRSIAEPDRTANEYLLNRIMGKPTERQEITGEDGGPIEVTDARERLARLLARYVDPDAAGADTGDPGRARPGDGGDAGA